MSFRIFIFIAFFLLQHSTTYSQQINRLLPLHYVAFRTGDQLKIDGRLDEPAWKKALWTEDFADIEGYHMPAPLHRTRAKIVWDDQYLYIGAELEEPHIWATYIQHESVIFHENNFEIFIDPNGDTHNYYELEINALGTRWDLMLTRPYRNGGLPITAWDIAGLRTGIHLAGTINQPADTDTLWSVEIALPWNVLKETAPGRRMPQPGDQWRVNFSRVQWQRDVVDGKYVKRNDPATGRPFPEFNWVWSPQDLIDMHLPERWGYVQFSSIESGMGTEAFLPHPDEKIKAALREVYHQQRRYFHANSKYALNLEDLFAEKMPEYEFDFQPVFEVTPSRFLIRATSFDGRSVWKITEDSRVWRE